MSRQQHQSQSANWIDDARRRLADCRGKKPETKAGQIWALWPEIKVALDDGHTVNSIRLWLKDEVEVAVTTDTLRSYISRFRLKEGRGRRAAHSDPTPTAGSRGRQKRQSLRIPSFDLPGSIATTQASTGPGNESTDPMAIARKALNKPRFDIRKIHGDGDPSDRKLI